MKDYTNGTICQYQQILVYVDGGCEPRNPGGVATGAWAAFDQQGHVLAEDAKVVADGGPLATNNYAEYCALGLALRWLHDQKFCGSMVVKSDSKLIVHQVLKEWKCNKEHLRRLRQRIWELLRAMGLRALGVKSLPCIKTDTGVCILIWVPRRENKYADSLGRKASKAHRKLRLLRNCKRGKQS